MKTPNANPHTNLGWAESTVKQPEKPMSFERIMALIGRPARVGAFKPSMFLNEDGKCWEIYLEDVPHHHEWIKGEGADISLWRAMDDNRIVGATLPYKP